MNDTVDALLEMQPLYLFKTAEYWRDKKDFLETIATNCLYTVHV